MSEFFARPLVSTSSMIASLRLAIADHRDPKRARERLSNLSWGTHAMEEQHLQAILEKLLREESEEREKARNSPPRAE